MLLRRTPQTVPQRHSSANLSSCAYVVLLYGSDAEYALGALLVASSLRRTGARARRLLLHSADVPSTRLPLLQEFYDEVRLIERPVSLPHDSPLCVCARDFAHPQFLKLHLLELEFDKVLYLDCDLVVRRNLDHLFELQAPAAMDRILAMPPHGAKLPNRILWAGHRVRGIQGGVMLLAPDKQMFDAMRAEVEDPVALREWAYRPSLGNEQDYLTWKYCDGLFEESGHPHVWTHLGCEYNYEVHSASTYFAIGRERWLWLDYERDAAVLHFSAPFRKLAKRILQPAGGGPSMTKPSHQQDSAPADGDPRVAFAYREWDKEVEELQKAIADQGSSLSTWLGDSPSAHSMRLAVIERSTGGMELAQIPEDGHVEADTCHFIFEAFSSNCAEGLRFFPPAFAAGPPWGACFWATAGDWETYEDDCETAETAETETELKEGTGGRSAQCGASSSSGGSSSSTTSFGKDRSNECKSTSGCDWGTGVQVSSTECSTLSPEGEESCGCQEDSSRGEAADSCGCRGKLGIQSLVLRPSGDESGSAIGAWLHLGTGGIGQWVFAPMASPLHLPDCPSWRLCSVFNAKVVG